MFIYRWPREIKIFSRRLIPDTNIYTKWYESIPVLGYIVTLGKYQNQTKKSILEVVIPILNIVSYLVIYLLYNEVVGSFIFMGFISVLICVSCIDFKYMLIPDRSHVIILLLGIVSLVCELNIYYDEFGEIFHLEMYERFIGLLVGFLPIYLLGIIISKLTETEALGGGDVKLLGASGFLIGWKNILLAMVIGSCIALIVEKLLQGLKIRKEDEPFAFGPYLAIAMIICVMVGPYLINWYLGLFS